MNLKELNIINRDTDFRNSVYLFQKGKLTGLTMGSLLVIGLWFLFDSHYALHNHQTLLWLRLSTMGLLAINMIIAGFRNTEKGYEQHLIVGFYTGAVHCTLLTMLTGASLSPYWYGLFFVLAGWYVMLSLPHRMMILHSMVFLVLFLGGVLARDFPETDFIEWGKMVFLFSGVFVIGGFSAISRNLADAKKYLADKELTRINADLKKFRHALDQAPLAVFIMDRAWRFEYLNPEFSRLSGYSQQDLLHQDIRDTLYKNSQGVPESRREIVDSLLAGRSWHGELLTNNKDGSTYWANTTAAPYKNELDVTDGYIVIQQDVTEKRNISQALQASEEQYKTLIEKATDGIVITQDGKLKFLNQAMLEMMQYSEDEMVGQSFLDYVVPESHAQMMEYNRRRMTGEKFHVLYRSWFIRKDGEILTVELNARTSEYEGRPAALIVIRDITNRLAIETELQQAKTELEELNRHLEVRVRESSEHLIEVRTQLIRLQKENLQSQFEVLRQQVNPHFLFNSLNVLTSLIKLEPDLAEKFTEHLSKVYRYVLENKDHELVELRTELDFLEAYLFLLGIRFEDKIQVSIELEETKLGWMILPLALQLLIENAIKHNTMSKRSPLIIRIFIDTLGFLHVENNLQERESFIASTGVGLQNIKHRYALLEMPEPEFTKTHETFVAKIPLKEVNIYD
jgi:PAS domain S-box-containing protein